MTFDKEGHLESQENEVKIETIDIDCKIINLGQKVSTIILICSDRKYFC